MLPFPKAVFACKADASAAGMMYVLLAGGDGLVAPERKPLEDALGTPVCPCPLCTKGKNAPRCCLLLACPSYTSSLTPEAGPCLGMSAAPERS